MTKSFTNPWDTKLQTSGMQIANLVSPGCQDTANMKQIMTVMSLNIDFVKLLMKSFF